MTYKNVLIESDFIRFLKISQDFSDQRNRNRNEMTSLFILHFSFFILNSHI